MQHLIFFLILTTALAAIVKRQSLECPQDAIYSTILHQGVDFSSGILKSTCTEEPLPTLLSQYPREQISSYVSLSVSIFSNWVF